MEAGPNKEYFRRQKKEHEIISKNVFVLKGYFQNSKSYEDFIYLTRLIQYFGEYHKYILQIQ